MKVFILCSNKGVIYDFELHIGKIQPADDAPDLGASSNIVLRLAKNIPTDKHYLLYFDNWFTSLPLVCHLAKSKIFRLGIVRRLPGCDLPSDKDMKKNGKGIHIEKESDIDSTTLRAIKWLNRKGVTLLTSFDSAYPIKTTQRYDRQTKTRTNIPCLNAVFT